MSVSLRIVKVGGSLFDWPPLLMNLRRWISDQPAAFNVLIAGGGARVDAIRSAYARGEVGDEQAHWQAIGVMSETARELAGAMELTPPMQDADKLAELVRSASGAGWVVCDVSRFLTEIEAGAGGIPLPRDWTVTSDSIAARLAEWLMADELVLLKSTLPTQWNVASPNPLSDAGQLVRLGLVDAFFPKAVANLRSVRVVNLRRFLDNSHEAILCDQANIGAN